jgi:hypothetical protein
MDVPVWLSTPLPVREALSPVTVEWDTRSATRGGRGLITLAGLSLARLVSEYDPRGELAA